MRVVIVMSLLVLLACCATSDPVESRQSGQVLICHKGKTLAVSVADMFVHESHGDSPTPCPD